MQVIAAIFFSIPTASVTEKWMMLDNIIRPGESGFEMPAGDQSFTFFTPTLLKTLHILIHPYSYPNWLF